MDASSDVFVVQMPVDGSIGARVCEFEADGTGFAVYIARDRDLGIGIAWVDELHGLGIVAAFATLEPWWEWEVGWVLFAVEPSHGRR